MTIYEMGAPMTAPPPPPNPSKKGNHPVTAPDPAPLTRAIQLMDEAREELRRLRERRTTLLNQCSDNLPCGPAGLEGKRYWPSIKDVLVAMEAVHAECQALKTTCAELEVLVQIKRLHREIRQGSVSGVT